MKEEVLEVLECEFRKIKEWLLRDVCEHLWHIITWMLDNSYRHAVISEIGSWLDYIKATDTVEQLTEHTRQLLPLLNSTVYEGLGLLDGVISYWIVSEVNTFDTDTLENIMTELLTVVRADMKGGETDAGS